jgi:uncharacterized protein
MVVGTLEIALRLDGCRSLKDKRRILRSLLDKMRNDFCVAIAEVEDHDMWGNAVVGVACVSNNAAHAESILQHVTDAFDAHPQVEIEDCRRDICRQ